MEGEIRPSSSIFSPPTPHRLDARALVDLDADPYQPAERARRPASAQPELPPIPNPVGRPQKAQRPEKKLAGVVCAFCGPENGGRSKPE